MSAPRLFFSCDWGTSSFRLRLVSIPEGRVLHEVHDPVGVRTIHSALVDRASTEPGDRDAAFGGFLRRQLEDLCRRVPVTEGCYPVVVSGMASSSVGWKELPYASAPFPLDGSKSVGEVFRLAKGEGPRFAVYLTSGVQTASDIMRGEEAEILGLFDEAGGAGLARESVVILPGTHSKHVWIRAGAIEDFCTYMTGELFDVLAAQSLLKASVQVPANSTAGPVSVADKDAFLEGVALAHRTGLARSLFQVRTRTVLKGVPRQANGWFLSGLLIGAEVSDLLAQRSRAPLLLAASRKFSRPYELALDRLGGSDRLSVVAPERVERASVRGHTRLLDRFSKLGQT